MRCKHCNVEIDCKTKICPLCHEKLDEIDESLPQIYPIRAQGAAHKKKLSGYWIYALVCTIIFIPCLAANLIVTPSIQWFWIVGILGIYGYVLIYNTIMSSHSIASKVLIQSAFAVGFIFAIYGVFKNLDPAISQNVWLFDYALPCVIAISLITMTTFAMVFSRKNPSLLLDCIMFCLTGFLPIILFAAKVVVNPELAYFCAVLCSVAILACLIIGRKSVWLEFKKKFHM